jgi:hypothetical protein
MDSVPLVGRGSEDEGSPGSCGHNVATVIRVRDAWTAALGCLQEDGCGYLAQLN